MKLLYYTWNKSRHVINELLYGKLHLGLFTNTVTALNPKWCNIYFLSNSTYQNVHTLFENLFSPFLITGRENWSHRFPLPVHLCVYKPCRSEFICNFDSYLSQVVICSQCHITIKDFFILHKCNIIWCYIMSKNRGQ